MLTLGEKIDMADFTPVNLVPVSDAQSYLHPIARALTSTTDLPAFLVDDGENQTSDLFIDEAENNLSESGGFENTVLFKLTHRLVSKGNAILIWWANNDLLAYQAAQKCTSIESLFEFAANQVGSNNPINVYLPPNPPIKRDAALTRTAPYVRR